jgi:hypothetical protein
MEKDCHGYLQGYDLPGPSNSSIVMLEAWNNTSIEITLCSPRKVSEHHHACRIKRNNGSHYTWQQN